jgi:hypothetical protein
MPKRAHRLFLIFLAMLPLGACQTISGQPRLPYDAKHHLDDLATYFDRKTIDACIGNETDVCRNQIVNGQIEAFETVANEFEREVASESGEVNVVGDTLSSALSAAGAIAAPAQSKTVFAALASFVTGGKASLDKNLYFQQSALAVLGRMEALREKALLPIRKGLLEDHATYPLIQALFDVRNYMRSGSVGAAITDIEQTSATEEEVAEENVQDIVTRRYGADANTDILRQYWKPNGKDVDPQRRDKLVEFLRANQLAGLDIVTFLNSADFAELRKKAVAELDPARQPTP